MILWKKIVAVRPEIQYYGFDIRTGNGIGRGIWLTHCMADSGNIVITPDGSLYSCEHCSQESRFGDIIHGITDLKAKKEFCRIDRVRDKCKKCMFLPECTSFSNCPIQDKHCREVREMLEIDYLKMIIEQDYQENCREDAILTQC